MLQKILCKLKLHRPIKIYPGYYDTYTHWYDEECLSCSKVRQIRKYDYPWGNKGADIHKWKHKQKIKIRKLTEKDCDDIYQYAIRRSQEILAGQKEDK